MRASLFSSRTRCKSILGRRAGIFEVASHVGDREDALYVILRCTLCGKLQDARHRDQLSKAAKSKHCVHCAPRPCARVSA